VNVIPAPGGAPAALAAPPEDPVGLGLVASLARPDGNLTGINWFASELAAKRLELLRELVPGAARVALLVEPANVRITESTVRDVEAAARAMRLQIRVLNVNTSREIDTAFATLASERPDAPRICRDRVWQGRIAR
jgi:putative ABC transport system substrate-binding protein